MTKKPSHLHTADPYGHPDEVEQPRADIAGKEPVHVRDWDESSLVNAIRNCQVDIIEDELAYLLEKPYWQQPRDKPFKHEIGEGKYAIPDDLVAKALDMCRLDNVPVRRTVEVPWDEPVKEQVKKAHTVGVTPAQVEAAKLLRARGNSDPAVQQIAEAVGPRIAELLGE